MKILKSVAEITASKYADSKFSPLLAKKQKEYIEAGDALYDIIFPDKGIIEKLPEPFFTSGTRTAIWVGDCYMKLEVSTNKRFPHNGIRIKKEDSYYASAEEFMRLDNHLHILQRERNKFKNEILAFIYQFSTVEKLAEQDETLAGFYFKALPVHEHNTPAITVASIIEKYPTLKETV